MAMRLNKNPKKNTWLIILALLLLIGIGVFLYHKLSSKPHITATPLTKGPDTALPYKTSTKQPSSSESTNQNSDSSSSPSTTKNNPPDKPTGIFVSNHRPHLYGDNLSNQVNSACTTTPGAKCTIVFTKGETSISLPTQETDAGGSTYWTWKLQDHGITEGTWSIKAIATLHGQKVSTTDDIDMVVSK